MILRNIINLKILNLIFSSFKFVFYYLIMIEGECTYYIIFKYRCLKVITYIIDNKIIFNQLLLTLF